MYELKRICLMNWYLFTAQEIDINGPTALIGASGAGKSSILDGIQTVLTGNNKNFLHLNASANEKSSRSVYEYCVGAVDDVPGRQVRAGAETLLALVFTDHATGSFISIGISLYASPLETKEDCQARFILRNHQFTIEDCVTHHSDGRLTTHEWKSIKENLGDKFGADLEIFPGSASARTFVADWLRAMRTKGAAPEPKQVMRAFANAVAFKPIDDTTKFVRRFILEEDMLDTERVRASLAMWKELTDTIAELKQQIKMLKSDVSNRIQNWALHTVQYNGLLWKSYRLDLARLAYLISLKNQQHETCSAKIEKLEKDIGYFRSQSKLAAEKQSDLKVRLSKVGKNNDREILQIRRDKEREAFKNAEEKADTILKLLSLISGLKSALKFLPQKIAGPVELAREVRATVQSFASPGDALYEARVKIPQIFTSLTEISDYVERLEAVYESNAQRIHEIKLQLPELQAKVPSEGSQRVGLSRHVKELKKVIEEHGIECKALPELIEEVDGEWAFALESLLGTNREALFVAPGRVAEAFDIMYQSRARFHGCRIARTDRLDMSLASRIERTSIASTVQTNSTEALAFIADTVGHFRKANDETTLRRERYAILRNGKTSGGTSYRVFKDLTLILGHIAAQQAGEEIQKSITVLKGQKGQLERDQQLLNHTKFSCQSIAEQLLTQTAVGTTLDEYFLAKSRLENTSQRLQTTRTPQEVELSEELEELSDHAKALEAQITELEQELKGLYEDRAGFDSHRSKLIEDQESASQEFQHFQSEQVDTDEFEWTLDQLDRECQWPTNNKDSFLSALEVEFDACLSEKEDFVQNLSYARNECLSAASEAGRIAVDSERKARSGYFAYREKYISSEAPVDDSHPVHLLVWTCEQLGYLEGIQLLQFEEAADRAHGEMKVALREDLLTRLYEKILKIDTRMSVLTRELRKHVFLGQNFKFRKNVEPEYSPLIELAKAVSKNPDTAIDVMGDDKYADAREKLEDLLQSTDDVHALADYRNYYRFDLVMRGQQEVIDDETDEGGLTLDEKIGKASGGEGQVPFYVAIGASLRSAYYPGSVSGDSHGFGLAMFDEALNKTDILNTQAVVSYYTSFGLQMLVAAPEDKASTFMEVVDTIVNISRPRGSKSAFVDVEYIKPYAKEALASVNPDRIGIEAFRRTFEAKQESVTQ